jgi:predicted O-methyltransferase YrrM
MFNGGSDIKTAPRRPLTGQGNGSMQPALDHQMTELERLMWEVYEYVRAGSARIYEGGASVAEATYLRDLAVSANAVHVAEVGFNVGFSSIAFLESSPAVEVVSFELDRRPAVELAKQFIDQRYPGRHHLVIGNSVETVPSYTEDHGSPFDLVFVDGGHEYETARADIANAVRIAKPGALIVVDDVIPWQPWGAGPHQAWQEAIAGRLVEPVELIVDGRVVEVIEEPGDRAWATGRIH